MLKSRTAGGRQQLGAVLDEGHVWHRLVVQLGELKCTGGREHGLLLFLPVPAISLVKQ